MWWFDDKAAPGWHDWVGLGLALVGFAIAYRQLRKTRTAAEIAAKKLSEARLKLNNDQLAAVLPQLASIVSDIDFAVDANDREVAHRALLRFSYIANEAIALLKNLEEDHSGMEVRLLAAANTALDVKGAIVGRKTVDIARNAKVIGTEVGSIAVELSGLVAKTRYQIGGASNV